MSTEIKPGQVWAWDDGRTGPGPEVTVTSLGEYVGGDTRVNYSYSGMEDVFDVDLASFRKKAHLVTDAPATPAPLDPSKVKAGDTVTVRFIETGEEFTTTAYRPAEVKAPKWVSILGWPLVKADGAFGLAVQYFEILAIQPAPEPEPEWEPGTVAVASVRGHGNVRVMRSHRTGSVASAFWLSDSEVDGYLQHPDEPHVADVRPLVVIDPAAVDVDNIIKVAKDFWQFHPKAGNPVEAGVREALRRLGIEVAR